MVTVIMDNTKIPIEMDLEPSIGLMVEDTMENGRMEVITVKENILTEMDALTTEVLANI
jgi:hypothetical protein